MNKGKERNDRFRTLSSIFLAEDSGRDNDGHASDVNNESSGDGEDITPPWAIKYSDDVGHDVFGRNWSHSIQGDV